MDYYRTVDAAAIEERLTEWARWCRASSSFHRHQTQSIEGLYRSPQRNHWEQVPWAPPPPAIAHRAFQTEKVVIALTDPWRLAIVLRYLVRAPEPQMRRRLKRWQVRDVAGVVDEAVHRVGERLER